MKKSEVNRLNNLYEDHQRSLKLQGNAKKLLMPIPGLFGGSVIISIVVLTN